MSAHSFSPEIMRENSVFSLLAEVSSREILETYLLMGFDDDTPGKPPYIQTVIETFSPENIAILLRTISADRLNEELKKVPFEEQFSLIRKLVQKMPDPAKPVKIKVPRAKKFEANEQENIVFSVLAESSSDELLRSYLLMGFKGDTPGKPPYIQTVIETFSPENIAILLKVIPADVLDTELRKVAVEEQFSLIRKFVQKMPEPSKPIDMKAELQEKWDVLCALKNKIFHLHNFFLQMRINPRCPMSEEDMFSLEGQVSQLQSLFKEKFEEFLSLPFYQLLSYSKDSAHQPNYELYAAILHQVLSAERDPRIARDPQIAEELFKIKIFLENQLNTLRPKDSVATTATSFFSRASRVDFSSSTKPLTFNENFERQTKDLSLEETGRYVMGRFEADDRMRELSGSVEITEPFFKKIIENLSSENFGLFMKALFLNTGKDMLGLEKFLNQELQKLEDQYGNNKLTMAFVRQLTRAFPDPSRSLSESLGSDDGKASGSSSQSLDLS